jgi:hypothetical protein
MLGFGTTAEAAPAAPAPAREPERPSPPLPPHPELEAKIAAGDEGAWQIYADWLIEQGFAWGEVISAALQGKPDVQGQEALERSMFGIEPKKVGWARGVMDELKYIPEGENDPPMPLVLEKVLEHPAGHFVRELTLGLPPAVDAEAWHFEELAKAIVNASPLPCLRKLDLSVDSPAMDQISWRRVGDISCLWKALPQLEELLLQGSAGVEGLPSKLAPIDAPNLKRFVFISGGLDQSVPLELGAASLPSLQHLELWLGDPQYGCTTTVPSLEGILSGARLPKVTSLAIKNSQEEGSLIEAVARSALLPRLEQLDFSMGIMGELAVAAFLRQVEKFKHLRRLYLGDNYFTAADQAALRAVLPQVEFDEQKPPSPMGARYISVSE